MVGKIQARRATLPEGEEGIFAKTISLAATDTPITDRNGLQWDIIRDLRGKGMSDQEILIQAVQSGNLDLVGAMMLNEPPQGDEKLELDLNDASRVGMIPLHTAVLTDISADREEPLMLKLLIEGGADIALLDQSGYSAYMHAAQFDKVPKAVKVAEWLKEKMNEEAKAAAAEGDKGRVDDLVAAGADPIEVEDPNAIDEPDPIEEFKLLDELDVLSMKTDIKDAQGNQLTVNAATIKLLMDKYEKGIKDGTYKKDSAQYKFYYGMRGMSDTAYGSTVTPYFENGADGGPSERWEGKPYGTTGDDMQDIYDPEKLKAMFADAAKDENVLKDWKTAQDEAMKGIENKDELKGKLKDMLLSQDFKTYLKTLHDKNDLEGATAAAQRGINAYAALATQEEVDEVVAKMGINDIVGELNTILASPEKIEDQYWEAATADWAAMMLEAMNRGIQLGRHGLNSLELAETKAWFEKLKKGSTELRQTAAIFKEFAKSGKLPETLSQEKLDQIASRVDSKWGTRGPIRSFFTNLNKAGAFSSAIGTLALAGSIYQMTGGEAFTEDHLQNMQIARGFLLFFGTTPEMFKLASPLTKFMGMGDTAAIFGQKAVRDIFKVDARSPMIKLADFIDDLAPKDNWKVPKAPIDQFMDKFKFEDRGPGGTGWKMAASVVKVLGAASFTGFGIVDAVLGGFVAKKGADTGDDTMLAQGIMQVFTGGFTTAAGVAMGLSAAGVAAAATFISPLLLVAAVIGSVIIAIDLIKALIEAFKEDDKASMGELEFYQAQADLGVLQSDWSEKFEFLRLAGYNVGGNNDSQKTDGRRPITKDGESVFDAYDWKSWLATYKANHKDYFNGDPDGSYDFPYPKGFRNGEGELSRQDYENVLNGAVSIYHDRIKGEKDDGEERTVPSLDGELRQHVKDLFKFYFQHINVGDLEDASEWVRDQIAGRIPNAYEDGDHGAEAKEIFENYYNKHDGKEDFETLGKEAQSEAYQGYENTLNSIVTMYAKDISGADGEGPRTVPSLTGDLREEVKNLFRYYFQRVDVGGTNASAAKWVAQQIKDRMQNAYENKDHGAEAAEIFWNYYDKHDGKKDLEDLAQEVYAQK